MAELELIAAIERALRARGGRVVRGPGDDAAVVALGGGLAVTSIDSMVEGVHFKLSTHSPADVGHKALATALSDLAAMGARRARPTSRSACRQGSASAPGSSWSEAMEALAERTGTTIAGGDVICCPAAARVRDRDRLGRRRIGAGLPRRRPARAT